MWAIGPSPALSDVDVFSAVRSRQYLLFSVDVYFFEKYVFSAIDKAVDAHNNCECGRAPCEGLHLSGLR